MNVTIDMEQEIPLNNLSISFMQLTGPGVYMPAYVEVFISTDGKNFKHAGRVNNDVPATATTLTFKDFKFNMIGQKARYIRVYAKNEQHGFMFADEIIIY